MQKKGRMKRSDPKNQNQLDMGHMMEPIAAHFYGIVTGNKVVPDTNMYQHADFPYALADFDYRFEDKDSGEPGILDGIPSTMSCSCATTWQWPTYRSVTLLLSGAIIPTTIWRHLACCVIVRKRI